MSTHRLNVVCCRKDCGKIYATKPCLAEEDGLLSHGICPDCYPKEMADLRAELEAMSSHELGPDVPPMISDARTAHSGQAATPCATLTGSDAVNYNASKDLAAGVRLLSS